jgi:hypothetical protein
VPHNCSQLPPNVPHSAACRACIKRWQAVASWVSAPTTGLPTHDTSVYSHRVKAQFLRSPPKNCTPNTRECAVARWLKQPVTPYHVTLEMTLAHGTWLRMPGKLSAPQPSGWRHADTGGKPKPGAQTYPQADRDNQKLIETTNPCPQQCSATQLTVQLGVMSHRHACWHTAAGRQTDCTDNEADQATAAGMLQAKKTQTSI